MDPRHGHQPMHSSDGRWVVVFNGELYNFRRLREQMLARGLRLNTQTDTEVLVELIASQGVVGTLTVIEGMFAFAALEKESGQIWLARDRFGEKPLYIDSRGSGFAFCSELSPLVVTASKSPKPSAQGILAILRHGHPWPGVTAFEGIREVMPGEWICRSATGEERNGVYWSPPDRVDEEAGSVERCGQKLLDLLEQSVRDRLVADVPLGLFLSGGLDSSTVVALASRARPDICAVTMGFDAAGYDEVPLARSTAHHLGVRLIEERAPYDSFTIAGFDCILRHYGQLFSDTSSVPTRMVSRAARRHFKVVLSGDGGDELLSGYFTHMRNALLAKWGGGSLGSTASGLLARLLPNTLRWEGIRRAVELNASYSAGLILHTMDGMFSDQMVLDLVRGTPWLSACQAQLALSRDMARQLWRSTNDSNLAVSVHHLRTSLPQDILTKVDRMSMAESLEVRAPFLDSKFAAYALSLPSHLKLKGGVGKYLLRHALRNILPPEVVGGPKRGFCLPVRNWLGTTFWEQLRREVKAYSLDSSAELNPAAVQRRIEQDEERCRRVNSFRALHRSVLLYSFLRWRRLFLGAGQLESKASCAKDRS